VLVVGAGRWGVNIVRDLVVLGVDVVVVDPDAAVRRRATLLGASTAVPQLSDLHGDGDGVAGVVVATPASTHADVVERVADLGVPIACEKPLTTSSESSQRLVTSLGGRLTVLHVWRYHPGIELLAGLIDTGRLGEVAAVASTRTNWTSPRDDVDPVWTLLPHDLSIGIALLGSIPPLSSAVVDRIGGDAVGVWATFEPAAGAALVVCASTRFSGKQREVRVHGTDAVAVLRDDGTGEVELLSGDGADPVIERVPFDPTPPLVRQLAAFVGHVRGGPAPITGGGEGLAVVTLVEQVLGRAGGGR
jgi:predicted dehydrogenase